MKKWFLFLLFASWKFSVFAQSTQAELYMPLDIKRAYDRGTRKKDGRLAERYWQNRSKYVINASIDPQRRLLKGKAKITYFNNRPDTLRTIAFHTYHDFYKPGSKKSAFTPSASGKEDQNHKGVVIEHLVIREDTISLNNNSKVSYAGTNYSIVLNRPLPPRQTLELSIQWNYIIPEGEFERSGAIDSTSMFVGYWYPEISVIDDIFGWDRITYDAATEFYHDYSDYEVSLTVPDNFMVWASVAPQNPAEVYNSKILERLELARNSSSPVNILTEQDFKTKATTSLTWKYAGNQLPDFAFALSDHFLWDAGTYKDEVGTYFLNTAYPPNHPQFANVLPSIKKSLDVFHHSFPAYPFPYRHFTIFNGQVGGGMEFPGMANNANVTAADYKPYTDNPITDYEAALKLTLHEMSHMYFPFLMGINEKRYAWMDEGFANFTNIFIDPIFPYENREMPYLGYSNVVPLMVPSYEHLNSGTNAYSIGSAAYLALYQLLGKELFLKGLHAFMNEWKHKHPTPYDMMFMFNNATGVDLNWFWNKWLFNWGYIDLGIKEVKSGTIQVDNTGGRPVGFKIRMTYSDGKTKEEEFSPAVWKNTGLFTYRSKRKSLVKVDLIIPPLSDAVPKNNVWVSPGAK